MWYLQKDVTVSAGHYLRNYDGACANPHGHNWKITVYCKGEFLNDKGILVDFKDIKKIVNEYDHVDLNTIFIHTNPTAENIAKSLCNKIPYCYKVMIEEQEGSRCFYVEN